MGQIVIKHDSTIEHNDIILPLISSSPDEIGDNYEKNQSHIKQTNVIGVRVPLISINGTVVNFDDIINFSLKSTNVVPTVSFTVLDRYKLIESIDTPGVDNEVQIQILPPFENAYKKINLIFYITKIKINNNIITINATYKLDKLFSNNFKSFGNINTYKLFSTIAKETGLGFASNIEENDADSRYIYCAYKSYIDLLNSEIGFGGSPNEIYDYWIDWWDNIILSNIYERYNTIDKDEELMVWISDNINDVDENTIIEPIELVATINNHPSYKDSQLYVDDYNIINNMSSQIYNGTDKIYSVFETLNHEHMDHLIQDGDVKKDIFTSYEYLGENYIEHNYLLQKQLRDAFLQKINSESIQVTLKTPLLGLMRGNKVNFIWYINNSLLNNNIDNITKQYGDADTNIPIEDNSNYYGGDEFIIDKMISGQYLITGCDIKYYDNNWHYVLTLNRPANQKPKFINL